MARMQDKRNARRKGGISIPKLADIEGRVLVAEGDYQAKVTGLSQEEGERGDYLAWKFGIIGGKHDGATVYYNTSLVPQALWNLKSLLETLGVEIPDDEFELEEDDVIDLELTVTIEHDTYNGKKQAKVVDFSPATEEVPKDNKRGKDKEDDKSDRNSRRRERRAERKGKEGDGDKRRDSKAKKVEKVAQEDVNDMGEDELVDLLKEHSLDVDLDEFSTLRRKRAAVIDALEDADLLAG